MNLPSNQITQNNASQDLDPNSVGRMKIILFFPVEKKTPADYSRDKEHVKKLASTKKV